MTRVTQSDNNSRMNWQWPVSGLGKYAMYHWEKSLQRKLDGKAAGRNACCENDELLSDIWFNGFPEAIEKRQVMLAMYLKQDPDEKIDAR